MCDATALTDPFKRRLPFEFFRPKGYGARRTIRRSATRARLRKVS